MSRILGTFIIFFLIAGATVYLMMDLPLAIQVLTSVGLLTAFLMLGIEIKNHLKMIKLERENDLLD